MIELFFTAIALMFCIGTVPLVVWSMYNTKNRHIYIHHINHNKK